MGSVGYIPRSGLAASEVEHIRDASNNLPNGSLKAGSASAGQGPEGPLGHVQGLFMKEESGSEELGHPVPSALVWVAEAGGGRG